MDDEWLECFYVLASIIHTKTKQYNRRPKSLMSKKLNVAKVGKVPYAV